MSEIDWIDKLGTPDDQHIDNKNHNSYFHYEWPDALDNAFTIGLGIVVGLCVIIMVSILFDM